jgi:hypothetical protein
MPDFPIRDVFAPLGWIFLVLLGINAALFVMLVFLREKWTFIRRRREKIRARLAPSVERLVGGADPNAVVEELRPRVRACGAATVPWPPGSFVT